MPSLLLLSYLWWLQMVTALANVCKECDQLSAINSWVVNLRVSLTRVRDHQMTSKKLFWRSICGDVSKRD